MNLFISLFPIILLIYLMTKRKNWPAHWALPATALLTIALKLFYSGSDQTLISAVVIKGILTAFTPIMIIFGAVFLFRTQENTGAMDVIRQTLYGVSKNKIAQVMIVGWAFAFLIEGASGFGTPAALAAPVLVGLGFSPVRVAMLCLVMNSVPVSFGAVGAPTWFGFSEIPNLSTQEIGVVGIKSAVIHSLAAFIIPIYALKFLFSWQEIKANIGFILISIAGCIVPFLAVSFVSYEFPSLIGGFVGIFISLIAANYGLGLEKGDEELQNVGTNNPPLQTVIRNTFPLWGTIMLLIITRIPALGLKRLLMFNDFFIGKYEFAQNVWSVSPALVFSWENILGTDVAWQLKALYVPGLIPFVLVSLLAFWILNSNLQVVKKTFHQTLKQMIKPSIALIASLIFVSLLMMDGDQSYAFVIGNALADLFGSYWSYAASYLGALGSFFSGSNTISNLTFGSIQDSIAQQLELNRTTILAMQSVGGSMGNMVCINNIVAVCSVLGLEKEEGHILRKTVWPMLLYGVIAGIVAMFLK